MSPAGCGAAPCLDSSACKLSPPLRAYPSHTLQANCFADRLEQHRNTMPPKTLSTQHGRRFRASAASFTFLYRTCGAGLRRRQFFKLEHHLQLHAFVWGRVSGYVFAFSLCLGEKETDSPFLELHISRDRVPCESRERHRDRGARACRTGRVRCVSMVMARGKSLVPRPYGSFSLQDSSTQYTL